MNVVVHGQPTARRWRWGVALFALTTACAPATANRGIQTGSAAGAAAESKVATIDHVSPAVDAIGRAPARFVWTAMAGADSYSIGVWNEVDQIIWRQDHITGTSVDRPDDVPLDPGTYLWAVSALRDGQLIGETGLAHFVVRPNP
jgi:hypothetical protein